MGQPLWGLSTASTLQFLESLSFAVALETRHLEGSPAKAASVGCGVWTRRVAHPYAGLTLSPLCALGLSAAHQQGHAGTAFSSPGTWADGLREEPGLGLEQSWFSPQPGHCLLGHPPGLSLPLCVMGAWDS